MSASSQLSINAQTQSLPVKGFETYAYRRFGSGSRLPLLLLQHFTGTLDNWDPALTDALARERELILFDNAGIGRSSGTVPTTVAEMAKHVVAFLDKLGVATCDVLGFSLGGVVAQQVVLDRPRIFRRLILVGTAPRGGSDLMRLDKPVLAKALQDPTNTGYSVLQKLFFPPTPIGQAAGAAFVERLGQRKTDVDRPSGPEVARADRRVPRVGALLRRALCRSQATSPPHARRQRRSRRDDSSRQLVSVEENLPNAVLLVYPDAAHGSLFQYHESFARQAAAFLSVDSQSAVY